MLQIVEPAHLLKGMFFFLLVIAGLVIFMAIYLIKRKSISARRRRLRQQFSDFISELAICDTEAECNEFLDKHATKELSNRWLKDKFARTTFIRELAAAARNMSGQAATNICRYYENAGLADDSLQKLKSKHWHIKARAIQQLAQLQQKRYITRIYRLTNDKHELVRNEARIAVVKLTGFEGLRFLEVISHPVTDWQQICLLHELTQHPRIVFPSLGKLLQSTNNSVVEFTLRLIARYQQFDQKEAVLALMKSSQPSIREKALAALMEIGDIADAATLIQYFPSEEPRLQVQILQVIQRIGSEEQKPFLLSMLSHPNHQIKATAARTLLEWDKDAFHQIGQELPTDTYPWNQLLPQLKHELSA
jgi:hypothetical protein